MERPCRFTAGRRVRRPQAEAWPHFLRSARGFDELDQDFFAAGRGYQEEIDTSAVAPGRVADRSFLGEFISENLSGFIHI